LEVFELTINIGDIDSKFRYILVAAKRTRQLQAGAKPMVTAPSKKLTRIAQEEVASGLVKYDIVEDAKPAKKRTKEAKESKGH
jgi:DNA-directed RNA polymerase subunit omega